MYITKRVADQRRMRERMGWGEAVELLMKSSHRAARMAAQASQVARNIQRAAGDDDGSGRRFITLRVKKGLPGSRRMFSRMSVFSSLSFISRIFVEGGRVRV